MLTVEYNQEREAVELYCDVEGLDRLLRKLTWLKERGGHLHFRTPTWAGDELTEELQGAGNRLINHLVISTALPDTEAD